MSKVQLSPQCIKNVPLQAYAQDFSFIVNGEEFKTSRLVADLVSQRVSRIHASDPTVDVFAVSTQHRGDFARILELSEFAEVSVAESESAFFAEVVEILDARPISLIASGGGDEEELSVENIAQRLRKHAELGSLYEERLSSEIEFASSHFAEVIERKREDMKCLRPDTLLAVVSSDCLRLRSEDDLLEFVNEVYSIDRRYSVCYEAVIFEHVTSEKIREFVSTYDEGDLTRAAWLGICGRLQCEVKESGAKDRKRRYEGEEEGSKFPPNDGSEFSGIICHLRSQSSNIENEIGITASSCVTSNERHQPKTVIIYENKSNFFYSNNTPNSWLCIDFKEHRVIPTDYEIRSLCYDQNEMHLKSWKLEGSTDNEIWTTLDEQVNSSALRGNNFVHKFHINHEQNANNKYRYIRIQETNKNWRNNDYLCLNAIEIYGSLI